MKDAITARLSDLIAVAEQLRATIEAERLIPHNGGKQVPTFASAASGLQEATRGPSETTAGAAMPA
jgi:hypothetical protein